tara:strand:- start:71549 stop:71905 length:357 start_codon:yes stop_codon:yes gene_type:complete
MKWLIILLTLTNALLACDAVELIGNNVKYQVCSTKSDNEFFYYSKDCKEVNKCVDFKQIDKLKLFPNQSPLFSLCYQLKGTPLFTKHQKTKKTVEICLFDNRPIGLNYLMSHYQIYRK